MTKKAAIYARVSSQKQKEGETIDSQLQALKQYALQEGYQIVDNWVFLDNGISGKDLQRPALDELRDVARTELLEAILIYAPDRLARSYPLQLILLEEFRKYGIKVCFIKGAPVDDTPEAVMFNHFQGIFAEYERALILDRSRRGRIYKAKQGDASILPDVPFGYRKKKVDRKTIVEIVEEEAPIVKTIFRLYIFEHLSLSEISKSLSEKGIKSPSGNLIWDIATIRDILKNPAYTGSAYYGKTKRSEGVSDKIRYYSKGKYTRSKYARVDLPKEEWLEINIAPMISENDFELAQEQINKNKEFALRNTKKPSLLQGLVICGECGHRFYKRFRKALNKSYYYCRTQGDRRLTSCCNGWVCQKELDDLVYNEIIELLENPMLIKQELQRRAKECANSQEIEKQDVSLKKELAKILKERDRLLDAYQSGLIDLKALSMRILGLDKRKEEIEKEIKALQAIKLTKESGKDWEKMFETILDRIKKSSMEISFQEKQQLIRLLVDQVVVSKENIKIMHCISPKLFSQENVQLSGDALRRPKRAQRIQP